MGDHGGTSPQSISYRSSGLTTAGTALGVDSEKFVLSRNGERCSIATKREGKC